MMPTPLRCTLRGAVIALAALVSFSAAAAGSHGAAVADPATPIVVAQTSAAPARSPRLVVRDDAFPAYQRGVREAASEGPEALRRYIWRTRMIYDFYFPDFVED